MAKKKGDEPQEEVTEKADAVETSPIENAQIAQENPSAKKVEDETSPIDVKPAESKLRRPALIGVLVIFLLCVGMFGYHYWQWSADHASTDDAYLAGDIVPISPQVSGQLTKVMIRSNQVVQRGELMMVIDDSTYRAAVEQAKADLQSAIAAWQSAQKNVMLTSATGAAQIAQAAGGVAAAQSGVGVAKANVDQSNSSINNASAALAGSRNAVQTAHSAIIAAQAQRAQTAEQASAAQATIKAAQSNLTQVEQGQNVAAASVEAAAANVEGAKHKVNAANAALATSNAGVSSAQAAVDSAQADADEASTEAARFKKLVAGGAVSQENADVKITAAKTAQAHLQAAKGAAQSAQAVVAQRQAEVSSAEQDTRAAQANYQSAQSKALQAKQQIAAAESQVAQSKANAKAAKAAVHAADAQIAQNISKLAGSQNAVKQAQTVVTQNQAGLQASKQNVDLAGGKTAQAQGQLQQAQTAPKQVAVSQSAVNVANAKMLQAQAALDKAEIDLKNTRIYAPVTGMVSKNQAEIGLQVAPEIPVLALVPSHLWVVANYKETQLTDVRVGQPVDVEVDAFPGFEFKGHVDSIAAATGATFALLPPENASGNFTKVVQRVPVKIVFQPNQSGVKLLRTGLSVVATIDTRRIVPAKDRENKK
ncbi:MAG: biotin/lipoyl-binding protein [Abditibacteriaceae bacterium]